LRTNTGAQNEFDIAPLAKWARAARMAQAIQRMARQQPGTVAQDRGGAIADGAGQEGFRGFDRVRLPDFGGMAGARHPGGAGGKGGGTAEERGALDQQDARAFG